MPLRLRIIGLGIGLLSLVIVAGCGSSSSSSSSNTSTASTAKGAVAVDLGTTKAGQVLVGPNGRAVYLFEKDKGTTSACSARAPRRGRR
jgi:predicted lipoprotein with Yx(FWY)xxD motif